MFAATLCVSGLPKWDSSNAVLFSKRILACFDLQSFVGAQAWRDGRMRSGQTLIAALRFGSNAVVVLTAFVLRSPGASLGSSHVKNRFVTCLRSRF